MVRRIRIKIHGDRVEYEFDGYRGNTCFTEAEKLKTLLQEKYGVKLETEYVETKPDAYEVVEEQVAERW